MNFRKNCKKYKLQREGPAKKAKKKREIPNPIDGINIFAHLQLHSQPAFVEFGSPDEIT